MEQEINNNVAPQVEETNDGLTIKDILFIARSHWIAIVAFVLAFTILGFVYSRVETPKYQSSATMLVSYDGSGSSSSATSNYQYANYVSQTFVVFLKQDVVLDEVSKSIKDEYGYEYSTTQLRKNMTTSLDSLVINVNFSASDPVIAQNILNEIVLEAQDIANSTEVIDGVATPKYKLLYDNLIVLSEAKKGSKVSTTIKRSAIGLAVGVVLAFVYVLIAELTNNKFKSTEEIERITNIPVLAGIPDYSLEENIVKKGGN